MAYRDELTRVHDTLQRMEDEYLAATMTGVRRLAAPGMSDVRWEGLSHEEIYSRVQQGPGRLASSDAEAAWNTVESTIRAVDAQLTRAVKQIGAGWQGGPPRPCTAG